MNNKNCNSCDSCNFCDSCDSCKFCDFCDSCDSCNSCDFCDSCNSCDFCDSCDFCNFCDFCYFCKNLRMTEHNGFCYSEKYNDEQSFQQKRYRAFNTFVGAFRYYEIQKEVRIILKSEEPLSLSDFWKQVTEKQWRQLIAIPEAKNFKKGFEYISGQDLSFLDEPEQDDATTEAIAPLKQHGYKVMKVK